MALCGKTYLDIVIASLVLLFGIVSGDGCLSGWLQHEQMCYKFSTETAILKEAKLLCRQIDATLVTVSDNSINTLIKENMQGPTWIGLIEDTISWAWANPSAFYNYENWNTYQERVKSPCVAMAMNGSWFGLPCNTTLPYFCEKLPQLSGCDMTYEPHGLFCYRKSITALNWVSSSTVCKPDGYLPSIVESSTSNFLSAKMDPDELVWLGLTTLEWVSGARYSFQLWDAPDHMPTVPLCVAIVPKDGGRALWQNTGCEDSLHYVCEKEATEMTTLSTMSTATTTVSPNEPSTTTTVSLTQYSTSSIDGADNGNAEEDTTMTTSTPDSTTVVAEPKRGGSGDNEIPWLPIVLGVVGVLVLIIIVAVIIICVRKRRTKDSEPPEEAPYTEYDHIASRSAVQRGRPVSIPPSVATTSVSQFAIENPLYDDAARSESTDNDINDTLHRRTRPPDLQSGRSVSMSDEQAADHVDACFKEIDELYAKVNKPSMRASENNNDKRKRTTSGHTSNGAIVEESGRHKRKSGGHRNGDAKRHGSPKRKSKSGPVASFEEPT